MAVPMSHSIRQSLHLRIDSTTLNVLQLQSSPDSASLSPASARASMGTTGTTSTVIDSELPTFPILCMHDFYTSDPDQLSFSKGEILRIIKQEDSGWWAAMRKGGDVIGWIPHAFVKQLSEEKADELWSVRQQLRVFELNADRLYSDAPIFRNEQLYAEPTPTYDRTWDGAVGAVVCKSTFQQVPLDSSSSP